MMSYKGKSVLRTFQGALEIKAKKSFNNSQMRYIHVEPARSTSGSIATVFGATGFIGRYIVESLASSGVQLVAPYRGEEKAANHLKPLGDVGQVVPVHYSVRDRASIDKVVSHSNIVVNLVGRHYETRNFKWGDVHVDATREIVQAAKRAGVKRFIHISAIGVENNKSNFVRSKAEGEKIVLSEFPSATILRIAPAFGPDDRLLNKFGAWTRVSPAMLSLVPIHTKIQPVSGVNVADAVDAVLEDKETEGKIYELGGPRVYTIEEFYREVIFTYTGANKSIIEVPEKIAKLMVTPMDMFSRSPLWVRDEIDYYSSDLVVSPKALSFKNLRITPEAIDETARVLLPLYKTIHKINV